MAESSSAGGSDWSEEEETPGDSMHMELLGELLLSSDDEDTDYMDETAPGKRRPAMTNDQKAREVLQFMTTLPRYSFRTFLLSIFQSGDPVIKKFANIFLSDNSHLQVMDTWWDRCGGMTRTQPTNPTAEWVINRAATVVSKEASWLTDRASEGPFYEDAKALRVPATDVSVKLVNDFRIYGLLARYERTTPHLQSILKSAIGKVGKDDKEAKEGTRDPDAGRTLATSIVLNLRSRVTNYHGVMNSLLLWDNRVPKRLVQTLNNLGMTVSYPAQCRAVASLSKSSVQLAREAANDPTKIKMFPYDNFNWMKKTYEASATHGSVQHDEVSALLVILPTPSGTATAKEIVDIAAFKALEGTRHNLQPPQKSLEDIMPSLEDHHTFRRNCILHIARALVDEIKSLSHLSSRLPEFEDVHAMKVTKTEEHYLPTFDQEQGSTRGNMVVLEHYFQDVLGIPKATFEDTMFTVLGDRLTTARDRAAQDQRAVDRSKDRFDHLSSFAMISGLMHYGLNFMKAMGGNFWGTAQDPVSLAALRDQLPNRENVQPQKVDYYAWQRFLDVIMRGLMLRASTVLLQASGRKDLEEKLAPMDLQSLLSHAAQIVDNYVLQSPSRLEATGVKKVPGNSITGNAVLLFHSIMTATEMQSAIKLGHTGRVVRVLKIWLPMFYAAGSYNYANETMELLHNIIHDWPKPYTDVARDGMLVNPLGKRTGFKPTDIRVEHLNDRIKEKAHGSNATPEVLEVITPAMGHISQFTDQLFEDLGVQLQNQHHAHVQQHRDVQLVADHLSTHHVFNFALDSPSSHSVVDLFATGLVRLSGENGGHAKHLLRHKLRLRTRHTTESATSTSAAVSDTATREAFRELETARDAQVVDYQVTERRTELEEFAEGLNDYNDVLDN
ncbi:hypothetical protein D9611_011724 [Ephemerocybe angulata]|uniref:DUF6589 domain-containing protein n=1 Tax=Ephemerocybe angulata TaxID=980116 RepID=A0A8H5C550_9AGAR|nr:hypothetical protein D9611_011718 [Tulosesus angulatus]KAF5335402.1 hypothetical protein D9611_011724 [Tulosesus angulatus]